MRTTPGVVPSRVLDYLVLALAVLLGVGSVLLFAWETRPTFVRLDRPFHDPLAWDAALSLIFFVQHSGMVRRSFRTGLSKIVPARYDGAVYAIASGIALTLVMVLWQRTDQHVMVLTGVLRWIVLACGALAGVVLVVSFYALWPVDMLGVRPIWLHLRARTMPASPFVVRGPYRFVRHPLYSCVIVLLWATPDMTADRLLLAASWTAWICVGALLEERDLVADFGDAYRRYQRQVPMLVPWRGRVQVRSEDAAGTRLLPT